MLRETKTPTTAVLQFGRDEGGATFYEAVLLASLFAVVCIIFLLALGKGM